ncbi:MAG: GIY-YIG nuclease family protein [Bacteroidales bacterium]|jgi:putative endonuclease
MYYVYALYSEKYNKIYIGSSSDLIKRINSHNDPRNKGWTSRFRPWILIYSEILSSKPEALLREKQLKSFNGRCFIRSLVPE